MDMPLLAISLCQNEILTLQQTLLEFKLITEKNFVSDFPLLQ